MRVELDTPSACIAPGEPGFPWMGLACVIGVGLALSVFLTGHATDELGVAVLTEQVSDAHLAGTAPSFE